MSTDLKKLFAAVKEGDVGIFGDPVAHSLSPMMQSAAFAQDAARRRGPAVTYHRFHVKAADLGDALRMARDAGMLGLNVTVPHKKAVHGLLDLVDRSAEVVESVNTVLFANGLSTGYNTDGHGFTMSLKEDAGFEARGKKALVLGAGGTGQVVIDQLLGHGAHTVFWWNRTPRTIKPLPYEAGLVQLHEAEAVARAARECALVVNATSVGLAAGDGLPLEPFSFAAGQIAFDVVYHRETEFLRRARAAGARTVGGQGMLLHQGARAFEIWTGAAAPIKIMRNALISALLEKGIQPQWPSAI